MLKLDASRSRELYERFKRTPGVGGIMMLQALRKSFDEMLAKSMNTSTIILTSFACVLAFAMIYNGARITLSERARELSSLRVLGMTKREVAVILLGEQAIFCAAAIPLGHLFKVNQRPEFEIELIEEAMSNFFRYFFIMPTLARFVAPPDELSYPPT